MSPLLMQLVGARWCANSRHVTRGKNNFRCWGKRWRLPNQDTWLLLYEPVKRLTIGPL